MAISADQAAQLASAYQSGDAGLQGLVNQMGATQADIQQYFPGFDTAAAGLTVPAAPTYGGEANLTAQNVRDLVAANINDPGAIARGMQKTGITEQDLGTIFQGTYTPEQISSYLSSPAAKLYATSYDGGSSPLTARESYDYVMANLADPTKVSQAATSRGYTAQDLLDIFNIYEPGQKDLAGIESYLTTGQAGFKDRFGEIAQDVFGSPEDIETLANVVYSNYQSRIQNNPNLTDAQKQRALSESRDDYITRTYGTGAYATSSLEDIQKSLSESGANRLQEAYRLGNIATNVLGYTEDDARDLINRAMSSGNLSTAEKNIFDALIQDNGISGSNQDRLMMYAAATNPEAPIFVDNPQLLAFYSPVGEARSTTSMLNSYGQDTGRGRSGQYGLYNNMPILNANVATTIAGKHGAVKNPAGQLGDILFHQIIPQLGIDFNSWTESTNWKAGRSIVGVDFDRNYIDQVQDFDRQIKDGTIIQSADENGTYYYRAVPNPAYGPGMDESPYRYEKVDPPVGQTAEPGTLTSRFQSFASNPIDMQGIESTLTRAADSLGISTKDKDVYQLFDEITAKTDGLYQLTGSAINAGMADDNGKYTNTMTLKESRDALNPENKNHFNALYKQTGEKLIPLEVSFFNFDPPKKGFGPFGGFFGDMLQGIASIPGIAELAVVASGGQLAPYYPAIKAVQVGGLTDAETGLKAGAKAWIMQQGISMADQAIGDYLIDQGLTDIDVVNALSEVGSNLAANVGIAALEGEDLSDAGLESLVASAVGSSTKGTVNKLGIPREYQSAVTQILADALLENDLQKSLSRIAMKEVGNQLKALPKLEANLGA